MSEPTTPTPPATPTKRPRANTALDVLTQLRPVHRPPPERVLHAGSRYAFYLNPKPRNAAVSRVFPDGLRQRYEILTDPALFEPPKTPEENKPFAAFVEVIYRKSDGTFGFDHIMLFFDHPVCDWTSESKAQPAIDEKSLKSAAEARAFEVAVEAIERAVQGIEATEAYLAGTVAIEDVTDLLTDTWEAALEEGADQTWFRITNAADITAAETRSLEVAIAAVEALKDGMKEGTSPAKQSMLFIGVWEEALERGNDEGWFAASQAVADANADATIALGHVEPWLFGMRPLDGTLDSFLANAARLAAASFCARQRGYSHVYIAMNDAGALPAHFGLTVQEYSDQTVLTVPVTESLAIIPELRGPQPLKEYPAVPKAADKAKATEPGGEPPTEPPET